MRKEVPHIQYPFIAVPLYNQVQVEMSCPVVILKYGYKKFIFSEDEFAYEAFLLVKNCYLGCSSVSILEERQKELNYSDKLKMYKKYEVFVYFTIFFLSDDKKNFFNEKFDFLATVREAKERIAQKFTTKVHQVKPEDVAIYSQVMSLIDDPRKTLKSIQNLFKIFYFKIEKKITVSQAKIKRSPTHDYPTKDMKLTHETKKPFSRSKSLGIVSKPFFAQKSMELRAKPTLTSYQYPKPPINYANSNFNKNSFGLERPNYFNYQKKPDPIRSSQQFKSKQPKNIEKERSKVDKFHRKYDFEADNNLKREKSKPSHKGTSDFGRPQFNERKGHDRIRNDFSIPYTKHSKESKNEDGKPDYLYRIGIYPQFEKKERKYAKENQNKDDFLGSSNKKEEKNGNDRQYNFNENEAGQFKFDSNSIGIGNASDDNFINYSHETSKKYEVIIDKKTVSNESNLLFEIIEEEEEENESNQILNSNENESKGLNHSSPDSPIQIEIFEEEEEDI